MLVLWLAKNKRRAKNVKIWRNCLRKSKASRLNNFTQVCPRYDWKRVVINVRSVETERTIFYIVVKIQLEHIASLVFHCVVNFPSVDRLSDKIDNCGCDPNLKRPNYSSVCSDESKYLRLLLVALQQKTCDLVNQYFSQLRPITCTLFPTLIDRSDCLRHSNGSSRK